MGTKKETKSKNTPWAPAEPFVKDSFTQLQNANKAGQASLDANMGGVNDEIGRLSSNLAAPPEYQTAAREQLTNTINGDYLNSNPHTGAIADLIAQKTGAQYNSTFGGAGRAHGGMAALLSAQGVGDALSGFYGNQYNQERGMQQQAIGMAPQFNQDEYTGINNLLPAVGNAATLPGQVAGQYASGITGATSPYVQNKTTEKTGGLGQVLSTGLGLAAQVGGAIATGGTSLGMSGLLAGAGGGGGLMSSLGGFIPKAMPQVGRYLG